jgi:ethanolamine ammonia-lyase large subunit
MGLEQGFIGLEMGFKMMADTCWKKHRQKKQSVKENLEQQQGFV